LGESYTTGEEQFNMTIMIKAATRKRIIAIFLLLEEKNISAI
jgi:hypothetical protein